MLSLALLSLGFAFEEGLDFDTDVLKSRHRGQKPRRRFDWWKKERNVVAATAQNFGNNVVNFGDDVGRWVRQEEVCEQNEYFNDCKDRGSNGVGTNNPDWMRNIPDYVRLSELTIPGTHDSAALHGGGAPWHVIAQSLDITKQLNAGIRYLDIRPRHYNNQLPIHHGQVYQQESFSGVLKKVKSFLQAHPKEMVFMRIKKEYNDGGNTKGFDVKIKEQMSAHLGSSMIAPGLSGYIDPTTMTLGQVRGRVVVLQNFNDGGKVIPGAIYWTNAKVARQDDYEINWPNEITRKKGKMNDLLNKARGDSSKLYINHASGTGAGFGGIKQVANPMNAYLRQIILQSGSGGAKGLGIFSIDFPGRGLIRDLIARNPILRTSGHCQRIISSQSRCQEFALQHGLKFSGFKSGAAPRGCYQWHVKNGNYLKVYYNHGPKTCTNIRRCICDTSYL